MSKVGVWVRSATSLAAACAMGLAGCEVEKRDLGPASPVTPPTSLSDARARLYAANRYEMAEGGRTFRWLDCDGCHTDPAPGYLDLNDRAWRRGGSVVEIYRSISGGAPGMPAYQGRLTPQQIWRLAGYVHGLGELKPAQRRRSANALRGEPSGTAWSGPLS